MIVRITMDLFQHRYYRLSKTLLTLIGQWPYQTKNAKRVCLAVFIFLTTSIFVPSLFAVVEYHADTTMLLKYIFMCILGAILVVKLISFMVHSQKTLKLINRIRTDWQVWARDREVNILHGYAEQGKKITILYTGMMYSSLFVFMAAPLIPKVTDIVLRNGTESGQFPLPVAYHHLNEQKYYFYLMTYLFTCTCLIVTPLLSSDIMLIIYVQHVCGTFAALGHKLERIGNKETLVDSGESSHVPKKKYMVHLTSCIDRHNDAIEYAKLIEAAYTRTFFVTLWLGMILINISGLQVIMKINDPIAITGFVLCVLAIMFYFYMECYISQILIDHSTNVRSYIYNSQWYRLSPATQKILQLMTMRCATPCQLTAGKMMILSVRNFWLVLKTAISYFRFLSSTQGL